VQRGDGDSEHAGVRSDDPPPSAAAIARMADRLTARQQSELGELLSGRARTAALHELAEAALRLVPAATRVQVARDRFGSAQVAQIDGISREDAAAIEQLNRGLDADTLGLVEQIAGDADHDGVWITLAGTVDRRTGTRGLGLTRAGSAAG
jgi:hypothetical protein